MQNDGSYQYEQLATFITELVQIGTLLPGSRVPSLRAISKQKSVSVSTALQAYRLLEDRGLIEAQPKSGYYVASNGKMSFDPPAISSPPLEAEQVSVSGPAMKLLDYANDPRFVPLGCAVPSPEILAASQLDRFLARAARTNGAKYNMYTLSKGDVLLRQEISRRALRWCQKLSPEDMAITCGCTEALMLALKAVTKPGDIVAIESPTYFGILHVLEVLNLKAFELPTSWESGVDLVALEKALAREPIKTCLFASSFNNPLGCTMPEDKKKTLLDILSKHQVTLIEDDIYGDIYLGTERPKPFIALNPDADIIYCSSFSKTIGPGYRIGWIVPGKHMKKVLEIKFSTTMCTPALLQGAFADYLSFGGYDNHLRRIQRIFKNNMELMLRSIADSFPADTKVTRPDGGFVLWLCLPQDIQSQRLFELALDQGICFASGNLFTASDRFDNCIRLSFAHPWNVEIENGIRTLGKLVYSFR